MPAIVTTSSGRSRALPLLLILAVLLGTPLLPLTPLAAPDGTTAPAEATPPVAMDAAPFLEAPGHDHTDAQEAVTLHRQHTDGASPVCIDTIRFIPLQGPSCQLANGMWKVLLDNGGVVFSHGPDTDALADLTTPAASGITYDPNGELPPVCADAPTDHRGRLIYAVPADGANNYASTAPQLRSVVYRANYRLHATAEAFGVQAKYRMLCAAGIPLVDNVVLKTPRASTTFSTIVQDLLALGFTSPYEKYWVYFEGSFSGYAGQATLVFDDRPGPENGNNYGPSFGISYGHLLPEVLMHENFHTLGAVQDTAPHATGYGHCNDGRDLMCYPDGGPWADYHDSVCATSVPVLDCNHDDYFNPRPKPGTYLSTHWNLASPVNHFLSVKNGTRGAEEAASIATLYTPHWVRPGARASFHAFVRNDGIVNLTGLSLRVLLNGTLLSEVPVPDLLRGRAAGVSIPWTAPAQEGPMVFHLVLLKDGVDPGWWGNAKSTMIRAAVPDATLRVAVMHHTTRHPGEHTVWEHLQRHWPLYGRTAFTVDLLSLSGAVGPREIAASRADIIVIGDGTGLGAAGAAALRDFVESGRALVGHHRALLPSAARPGLEGLFGLATSGSYTQCFDPAGRSPMAFTGAVPGLERGQPASFTASKKCTLMGYSERTARVAATSSDRFYRVTALRHRDAGLSQGVALFASWDFVTLHGSYPQGESSDRRLLVEALLWATGEAARRDAVDGDLAALELPARVCLGQGTPLGFQVANRGSAGVGSGVVRVFVDGASEPTLRWDLGSVAAGEVRTLTGTLPAAPTNGTHTVLVQVDLAGDLLPGNDRATGSFVAEPCGSAPAGVAGVSVGEPFAPRPEPLVDRLLDTLDEYVRDAQYSSYWLMWNLKNGLGDQWVSA